MQSINFDTGYKTYTINGDENNVIRVNLTDPNLIKRIETAMSDIEKFKNSITNDTTLPEVYEKFDKLVKDKIDFSFGIGTSKAVFGDLNCLAVANDKGECIFETFLAAILPAIQADMEQAMKSQNKHISDMVDTGKLDKYVDKIKGAAT